MVEGGEDGQDEIGLQYVSHNHRGFLHLFSLKMSIYFAYFGLESGMVFERTTGVYEHIYRFNSK